MAKAVVDQDSSDLYQSYAQESGVGMDSSRSIRRAAAGLDRGAFATPVNACASLDQMSVAVMVGGVVGLALLVRVLR